jgi:hypothetical protein
VFIIRDFDGTKLNYFLKLQSIAEIYFLHLYQNHET